MTPTDTVRCGVFRPGEPGYAEECFSFNPNHPLEPAVVVAAETADDVAQAVRFARARSMPVAVNATSHHVVHPAREAVLVTTSRLGEVTVDVERRTARVGAGVRWQQVLDEAGKAGLAPIAGSAPAVGVVGYTLGGGLSPVLGRSLGYAADHVRRIELVTADGEQRVATPEDEPDLFWALRGGLGNFGVVTAMEFDLFPHARFHGGGLYFPGADAAAVLHAWREWAPTLPEDATTSVMLQRLPPLPALPEPLRGAFVVHLRFAFLGTPEEGERLLAPMRAAAPVVLDLVGDKPFPAIGEIHLDPTDPIPHHSGAVSLAEFGPDVVGKLLELAGPGVDCPLLGLEVRALGGALDREPSVPNAVPSRGVPFLVFGLAVGGPESRDELAGHLAHVSAELRPWALPRRLPTFLLGDDVAEDRVRAAYGAQYERLAAVKKRYDPENVFRFTHNIPPAA
ncbi:FAD-binding oxidoreductase [Amycolatopsis nalaikhensis]|uniref:FAD-binding oxidoreductase n=1 Tax=Amycolatopsis nalaikhensis TaxID=715472 RepID=A0ABY8XES5_9PSEU|nr:FAD-binding oxidoreductase [Amycolatopsis sp. 2-2]WIV54106.1 FAD-binding oxidoreductase [Amycolatopsis sp. 2-2]